MTINNEINQNYMKSTMNINNNIFIYAFTGVIFFIAAIGFAFTNFSNIAKLEPSSMLVASTLGVSSLSLIAKAIKEDKQRLRQQL